MSFCFKLQFSAVCALLVFLKRIALGCFATSLVEILLKIPIPTSVGYVLHYFFRTLGTDFPDNFDRLKKTETADFGKFVFYATNTKQLIICT